ncbi:MAG TPA: hypothetical protein VGR73_01200 [Bryobacteraceae bacterium]|nr:hypothetical protein [Bryobacteraceae bacterium]
MNGRISNATKLVVTSALVLFAAACSSAPQLKEEAKAAPPPSVPDLKVSPAAKAQATDAKPAAQAKNAKKKPPTDTFGKGKSLITVKGHPGGANHHSFWSEELDVDGSGQPVLVDVAWDNSHKVMYLSRDSSFTCRNGQSADGSILTAIYGKGAASNRPAGSGWWVAELDEGECGVHAAGLYGCKFNSDGVNSDCGSAVIQEVEDDVVISPLPGGDRSSATAGPGGAADSGTPSKQ